MIMNISQKLNIDKSRKEIRKSQYLYTAKQVTVFLFCTIFHVVQRVLLDHGTASLNKLWKPSCCRILCIPQWTKTRSPFIRKYSMHFYKTLTSVPEVLFQTIPLFFKHSFSFYRAPLKTSSKTRMLQGIIIVSVL